MMSNSIDVNELKDMLEEAYPVGKIKAIESIACDEEELLCSAGSLPLGQDLSISADLRSSFRVTAASGEYFLKRVSERMTDEQLARVEHFVRWVLKKKIDLCPALIATRKREMHLKVEGLRFQLFEFVQQEKRQLWMHSDLDESDCRTAGQLLASFTEAVCEYALDCKVDQALDLSCGALSWEPSVIGNVRTNWNQIFESFVENEPLHPVLHRLVQVRKQLESRLDEALSLAWSEGVAWNNASRYSLVHGDFHPGNILFSRSPCGERVAWLVDFDHMHHEHRFFDAGYALIMFSYNPSVFDAGDLSEKNTATLDKDRARAFLTGWLQELSLCDSHESKDEHLQELLKSAYPEVFQAYMTIACFLIMDWAVERLLNGAGVFANVYAGVISDMMDLLLGSELEESSNLYLEVMKELVT